MNILTAVVIKLLVDLAKTFIIKGLKSEYAKKVFAKLIKTFYENVQPNWRPVFLYLSLTASILSLIAVNFLDTLMSTYDKHCFYALGVPLALLVIALLIPVVIKFRKFAKANPDFAKLEK